MGPGITFLTPHSLLVEKGVADEGPLAHAFRLSREMDHHREYTLWPWAIWQSAHRPGAMEAELRPLFYGNPEGDACLKAIEAEVVAGAKWLASRCGALNARTPLTEGWPQDLREDQKAVVNQFFTDVTFPSFLDLASGQGKTRVALEIAKSLGGARVWVSNLTLIRQWKDEWKRWWPEGFPTRRPGNTLPKIDLRSGLPSTTKDLEGAPCIIVDEAHRFPQKALSLLAGCPSPVLGMSATPHWPMELDLDFFMAFGPILAPQARAGQRRTAVTVHAVEVRFPLPHERRHDYLLATGPQGRYRVASNSHLKESFVVEQIRGNPGARILVMGQYLESLKNIAGELGLPVLTGTTSPAQRWKAYQRFNEEASTKGSVLVTSAVSDEGVDLPEADMIFQVSGAPGDPVQEVQRLGRLLRPKLRPVTFYSLVTAQTVEEESARQRRPAVEALGILYEVVEMPAGAPSPEASRE